jgi:sugar O-acyltransferase (sialic acid O-acetyltransferase NeuD family)
MRKIVVVGSSGQAKVVIDILRRQAEFHVVGLIDRFRSVGEATLDLPVLGGEDDLPRLMLAHSLEGVVVAIGDNQVRSIVAARVAELCPGLAFVSAIHPSAQIGMDVSIGPGTVVMAGAVVNPCTRVGRFCILNTNCSLDHDGVMDDFASLAPRAVTGGNCRIGTGAAVGIGAVLLHGVSVGEHAVVGAGSLVTRSIGARVVAYGSPARVIRPRSPGDRYL